MRARSRPSASPPTSRSSPRRTNALVGAGGTLQLPWPRALGTPPWGARRELEFGAADPEADYDVSGCASRSRAGSSRRMPPCGLASATAVPRCSTSATRGCRGTSCSSCRRRRSRSSTSTSRPIGRVVDLPRRGVRRTPAAAWPAGTCRGPPSGTTRLADRKAGTEVIPAPTWAPGSRRTGVGLSPCGPGRRRRGPAPRA